MSHNFDITKLSDDLFRHEAGRMVAVLTRTFGTENLELSEDVVQETFISAMKVWALKGIPDNPSAWLFRVAKNKAIDILRKNKFSKQVDLSDSDRQLLSSEYTLSATVERLWCEDEIEDDLLRMMYACCHPEISIENQVALILKTLCGFSTQEIASAFITSEDTVSKRLYRTKNFFRDQKIKPEFPGAEKLAGYTDAVLRAIYLIFNEGYYSTHTDGVVRRDLIDQAMYLGKLLSDNAHTRLPQVFAAMAMMCFHAARLGGRVDSGGDIILLADQDRTLWDEELISAGNSFMNRAAFGEAITSYHFEAAIAYEHCSAQSYAATNWSNILNYYNMLMVVAPGPVVALHRLTAFYKTNGAAATIAEIDESVHRAAWEGHFLFYCLLGDLYADLAPARSASYYGQAIELSRSEKERSLLKRKMEQLG